MLKNDAESNAATEAFVAADIDQILAAGERVTIGGGASKAGGAFSKATFTAEEAEEGEGEGGGDDAADEVPAVDDPHFWSKLCPERAAAPDPFLDRAARRRRAAVIDQASGMPIAAQSPPDCKPIIAR